VSRRGPSPAQKKQARKADRAEARARETAEWDEFMVLEPAELRALLRYLEAELAEVACEHTLRLTLSWAKGQGKDPDRLVPSLNHFGGGCDCEVLANVDPETRVDTWARY
jgi:hypothetical protein